MWSSPLLIVRLSTPFATRARALASVSPNAHDSATNRRASLAKLLHAQGVSPGSACDAQLRSYYSPFEETIASTSRVNLTNPQDVSSTAKYLSCDGGKFPLRSAGPVFPGITADMIHMNSVSRYNDRKNASLASGGAWGRVYDALAPTSLTALGGRSNIIGVGGYLLGGGNSNLSLQHSFTDDNVVNYQVVLPSGEIVEVNPTSNPGLFWALKAGSGKFSITTRHDVATYLGATIGYRYSQQEREVSDALLAFLATLSSALFGIRSYTTGFNGGQDTLILNPDYIGVAGSKLDLFSGMLATPFDTLRPNVNQQKLPQALDVVLPAGLRAPWPTTTFNANTRLDLDISSRARSAFTPFHSSSNVSWSGHFQTFPASMLAKSEALYLDCASPDQPVYANFGEDSVALWKDVQRRYHSDDVLGSYGRVGSRFEARPMLYLIV